MAGRHDSNKRESYVTSEVLILNKRAVILGADSAVTTSGGEHPRYSKSANKIFELSRNGFVAAAIYGNALIDLVPWELALKLFRSHLRDANFSKVSEYSAALMTFLSGNEILFPSTIRANWIESQFDIALKRILEDAARVSPAVVDETLPIGDRAVIWKTEAARIRSTLNGIGIAENLSKAALDQLLQNVDPWAARAQSQIDQVSALAGVDASELAELGHIFRYTLPDSILGSSGLVVAGYGEDQIFPAYEQLDVFGHVGDEIFYKNTRRFEVTHTSIAMIQPLAQTSMIDMFTSGFGSSLERIISKHGTNAFGKLLSDLAANGISVPQALADSIGKQCHEDFMNNWRHENWDQNFFPLVSVLQSLSVQEMAHLAESLLGLESLKERVTSPSESVGGPIDVAAITKTEGLVWIKRKHYFDQNLNMRYAARLQQSFN